MVLASRQLCKAKTPNSPVLRQALRWICMVSVRIEKCLCLPGHSWQHPAECKQR